MESFLLRAEKIAARSSLQPTSAGNAAKITRLVVHSRLDTLKHRSRTVLGAVGAGAGMPAQEDLLDHLVGRDLIDTIELRRNIAACVIDSRNIVRSAAPLPGTGPGYFFLPFFLSYGILFS